MNMFTINNIDIEKFAEDDTEGKHTNAVGV